MQELTTAPFAVDADAIAEGLIEMFTKQERAALRFGMLPAEKMEVVKTCLKNRFLEKCKTKEGDDFFMLHETPEKRKFIEFKMSKLVAEATHLVCLALYKIGDLVV